MQSGIHQLLEEVKSFSAQSAGELEQFRLRFLSKKGIITELFEEFKQIPGAQKKETGLLLNELKNKIQEKIDSFKSVFDDRDEKGESNLDLTRPDGTIKIGARHPLSIVRNQIIEIFSRIGLDRKSTRLNSSH